MNQTELHQLACELDERDTLAGFRTEFFIPTNQRGQELIYLCGNSLGLQPKRVPELLQQELKDWQNLGVEGHFHAKRPWMPYHEQFSERMANVVGARADEVICMNSLTVNLHLMMVSFYRPTQTRNKILIERGAFPSDRYAVESQIVHHGFQPQVSLLELEPRSGEHTLHPEDIDACLDEFGHEIALVLLPGVQYYSGQVFDLHRITRAAQAKGCTVGWDLAHSVGNVPMQLHDSNADFAVWCNYKYMNAGPGAIGGCFIHQRHCDNRSLPRFAGWWGQNKARRFQMGPEFDPIPTAEGWQLSNPPILAMTPLLASLRLFEAAGITALHQKSLQMGRLLITQLTEHFAGSVDIITPHEDTRRGGQLSISVRRGGKGVFDALIRAGVICDWREPDCIRLAVAPLYNRFRDIAAFCAVLTEVLNDRD